METNTNANLISNMARHWYWGLPALLIAVVIAVFGSDGGVNPVLASNSAGIDAEASAAVADASCPEADLTGDCAVSGQDVFKLLYHMGQPSASGTGASIPGDLTGDGFISGLDLFELLRNFGARGES